MNTRESRNYTHSKCKTQTEVSGPEFSALSDPLAGMKETFCAQCDGHFPLSEFVWSDTSEKITDYYARHSKKATDADRFLFSTPGLGLLAGGGFFLGVMFGALLYFAIGGMAGFIVALILGLVGAVAGVVVCETVLKPKILGRVCGVSDTRNLQ